MNTAISPTVCGTFTRARRYPLVVARVWGRRITLNFTVGAALGLLGVWVSRVVWEHGPVGERAWLVYVAAGVGAGAFLHRGRLDGRAPLWTIYTVGVWAATAAPVAAAEWVGTRSVEVTVPAPAAGAVTPDPAGPPGLQLWVTPRAEAAA